MKKPFLPLALASALLVQSLAPVTSLTAVAATPSTGVVQLWQEIPSGQDMPKGMTEKELKEKLYCRLNHTLTPATTEQTFQTYVNSCYVDDVLYLGESSDQFKVYVSGYEGWVPKKKASKITLKFPVNQAGELVDEGTPGSALKAYDYLVYTTAHFLETSSTSSPSKTRSISESAETVKYEGEYVKSYETFEEINRTRSVSQGEVQSPSYYIQESGQLIHYISENVAKPQAYHKVVVGLAPAWMKANQPYFSYDGVYFFTDLSKVTPSGNGAVNADQPYYNYYQYVSTRSQSNLTGLDLDRYTKSKGYQSTPYSSTASKSESQLVGQGETFEQSQTQYGVNQSLQYAMAIQESAFGRSGLSVRKNNLFGMNAADLDPSGQSTTFQTVEESILHHADAYLSKGYTDPLSDSRYYGAHLGNKGSGMNVKYSSDPYWGEKIAGIYHQLDKTNQYADLDTYSLGIADAKGAISVYREPNSASTVLYQLRNNQTKEDFKHAPLLIVGETEDFYQVKTDTPINANGKAQFDATYNWSTATGYVLKSQVSQVSEGSYRQTETMLLTDDASTLTEPLSKTTKTTESVVATGKVLTNSLRVRSSKSTSASTLGSVKKGQTVSILEIGTEWHKISYQNKVGYVSANYIEVSKTEVPSPETSQNSNQSTATQSGTVTTNNLKVRTGAGTSHSILGQLKKGEQVEIVETKNNWHRIKYGTGFGYVSADYVRLNETSNAGSSQKPAGTQPAIYFESDIILELGETVDVLSDVVVLNVGDQGYVLDILNSTVDLTKPGTYHVEYVAKYGENFANELTQTRQVIVQDTQAPLMTLKGEAVITLSIGEVYKEPGVSVKDNSGEIIKYVISGHEFDTSVAGTYKITYTATDSSGNARTLTREVRVQDPSAPILTLKGETYLVLRGGESYQEPGYEAVDGHGNVLEVTVTGADFDHLVEGKYTIEYSAVSKTGAKAVATRVVVVKDASTLEEESPYIGTGKPTINNLNIRSGRGTSYKIIGKLNSSQEVNVLDLTDHWYQIEFDGKTGYVHEDYLTFTERVIETPETPVEDEELPLVPETESSPEDELLTGDVASEPETSPEEEKPADPITPSVSKAKWLSWLWIGFGLCLAGVLGLATALFVQNLKNKRRDEEWASLESLGSELDRRDDSEDSDSDARYY